MFSGERIEARHEDGHVVVGDVVPDDVRERTDAAHLGIAALSERAAKQVAVLGDGIVRGAAVSRPPLDEPVGVEAQERPAPG